MTASEGDVLLRPTWSTWSFRSYLDPSRRRSQILAPTPPAAKRSGCSAVQCLPVLICYCTGQCSGHGGFAKVYSELKERVLNSAQVWASGCCVPAEPTMMFSLNLLSSGLQYQGSGTAHYKVLPCHPQNVYCTIRGALKGKLGLSVEPAILHVLHKY